MTNHEISHIDYLNCQKLIQIYVSIFKITGDDSFANLVNIVGQILNKPYSQQQESDADYYGVELVYKAGYNEKKMADFFKRMETKFYSDKERENLDKDLDRFFFPSL
ncbi:MAG: M48 family metalloprotease [Leptospiraceae bacterium]|nr:M48 family metalloprotease [Leptospiraceae bacterium]MCP5510786.1 M48 family metalloprotease [Leptospiraceae bacterium]